MLRRSDIYIYIYIYIYTIFTCVRPKCLMSRCNHSPPLFFRLVLLSTVEIGSLTERGERQKAVSLFIYLQHVRVWLSHLQLLY